MDIENKMETLEDLELRLSSLRSHGKKIVHCHGVFDLLHIGHITHFEDAKRFGDVLVVTITPDRYVGKGPHRPAFEENLRARAVAALGCVDHVAINKWPTAVETIKMLKPHFYVKGHEYENEKNDRTGGIVLEEEAIRSVHGQIVFTKNITFSSSNLINNHFSSFPAKTERWLRSFRQRYSKDDILEILSRITALKPLVIGEAIIDEYCFCDGLGKSTKDPILAFSQKNEETYAGGSLAVANHLAGFCKKVGLITMLGDRDRKESFIRQSLKSNVEPSFVTKKSSPTIHKRRFVDNHTLGRLLEIYLMNDAVISDSEEIEVGQVVDDLIDAYDLVIVTDYGHGMFTSSTVEKICKGARFLAVNTQANAGNRGFNTISKYPKADYVCLAGHEVALETRMRPGKWRDLIGEVAKKIDCPRFTMTEGKSGSIHYGPDNEFVEVPAFAPKVMDRVGAGDAVLSITSLLVSLGVPWEIVGFFGNLAGSLLVAELGNRISLDRLSLERYIISIMK